MSTRILQQRDRQREALLQSLRAYVPPPPFPNPELIEELKPPVPVAVTQEHDVICNVIDVCDEYCGDLDVAPDSTFLCPVTHLALRDPVTAPDGYVYEKTVIETSKKAASGWTSPMTRMLGRDIRHIYVHSPTETSRPMRWGETI